MKPELIADPSATADDLRNLLLLVGDDVPVETIARWCPLERCVVADWATRVHLRASDNRVLYRQRPSLLDTAADRALLVQAADALWEMAKTALTVKPLLDQPYPDAPEWTPWTRWMERRARTAHDLKTKIRKHLKLADASTPEEPS